MQMFNSNKNGEGNKPKPPPSGLFLAPEGEGSDSGQGARSQRGTQAADIEDVVPRAVPTAPPANNGRRSLDLGAAAPSGPQPAPAPAAQPASKPEISATGNRRTLNLGGDAAAPLQPEYAAVGLDAAAPAPAEPIFVHQPAPVAPPVAPRRQEPVVEAQPQPVEAAAQSTPHAEQESEAQPATPEPAASGVKMSFKRKAQDEVKDDSEAGSDVKAGSLKKGFASFANIGRKSKDKDAGAGKPSILKPRKPVKEKAEKGVSPLAGLAGKLFAKKPLPEAASAVAQEGSATQIKPEKKPFWTFGKKPPKVAGDAAPAAEAVPKAKSKVPFGWPKAGKKAAKPEGADETGATPKKGAKGAKVKGAAKKQKSAAAVNEQYILVRLNIQEDLLWKVGPETLQQIPMESLGGKKMQPFASFTQEDVRIFVDAPQSYGRATELALQALEEKPRVINLSKTHNAILTTPAMRLQGFKSQRVGPGLMLLESLLKDYFEEKFQNSATMRDVDVISGFMLQDAASGQTMVILYHYEKNGDIYGPEVVVNPADVNMTLRSFATQRKVDASKADFRLYRNAELLGTGVPKHLYPSDAILLGLPLAQALAGAALVSTVAAVAATGFAAQTYVAKQSLKVKTSHASRTIAEKEKQVNDLMGNSVRSFAKKQSISVDGVVGKAAQLWVPGTLVHMAATGTSQKYSVHMAMVAKTDVSLGPSLLDGVTPAEVQALMDLNVPEGCSKQTPSVTGTLDAIQLVVTCETAPGPLHRYNLD